MNFGQALDSLRLGSRLQRDGWNGRGLWIELQVPDAHSKMTLPYLFLNYPGGNVPSDRPGCAVTAASQYAEGARVPWVASQTDILSNDWRILL